MTKQQDIKRDAARNLSTSQSQKRSVATNNEKEENNNSLFNLNVNKNLFLSNKLIPPPSVL